MRLTTRGKQNAVSSCLRCHNQGQAEDAAELSSRPTWGAIVIHTEDFWVHLVESGGLRCALEFISGKAGSNAD